MVLARGSDRDLERPERDRGQSGRSGSSVTGLGGRGGRQDRRRLRGSWRSWSASAIDALGLIEGAGSPDDRQGAKLPRFAGRSTVMIGTGSPIVLSGSRKSPTSGATFVDAEDDKVGTSRRPAGCWIHRPTAAVICVWSRSSRPSDWFNVGIEVTPFEVAGGVLERCCSSSGSTPGYDRWWEARKLWGGITNQCRNLATTALGNGPDDPTWRREVVAWTIAFAHSSRRILA